MTGTTQTMQERFRDATVQALQQRQARILCGPDVWLILDGDPRLRHVGTPDPEHDQRLYELAEPEPEPEPVRTFDAGSGHETA